MVESRDVATVRKYFQSYFDGNFEEMLALHSKDVVWEICAGAAEGIVPYFGTFRGKVACRAVFDKYVEVTEEKSFEVTGYYDAGEWVFVTGSETALAKPTGRTFSTQMIYMIRVENDQIAELRRFVDTAAFAKAYAR